MGRKVGRNRLRRSLGVAAASLSIGLMCSIGGLVAAPVALAGSGDYCGPGHKLEPGSNSMCVHQLDTYKETEGWDTYGEGKGSCTGVSNSNGGTWYRWNCSGNGGTYDETYWRGEGETQEGYGFVSDNSGSYTSYYTGWGYWN